MRRLAFLLPLALAACGSGADPRADNASEPVALVRTAPVELGTSGNAVTLYGAAEASPASGHIVVVPSEARIVAIAAPTGTAVARGQVIATLAPSPATQLEIARAASDASAAQAALQRALRLRADGLVSDAEVETARAAARTASATRANLGMYGALALRAPAAGTVQALTARPGEQLAAGATLAAIAAPGDLRARFGIDPALAARVSVGRALQIMPANGRAAINAVVVGVDPQVDPATRLASVFARLAGSNIAAGEPLRASLAVGATSTGVTIPYAALLDDGGRSYVYVVKDGVAKARTVSPGNSAGDRIQILSGLRPGERVVTEGGTALEDGMRAREDKTR